MADPVAAQDRPTLFSTASAAGGGGVTEGGGGGAGLPEGLGSVFSGSPEHPHYTLFNYNFKF